eukprot:g30669.t1
MAIFFLNRLQNKKNFNSRGSEASGLGLRFNEVNNLTSDGDLRLKLLKVPAFTPPQVDSCLRPQPNMASHLLANGCETCSEYYPELIWGAVSMQTPDCFFDTWYCPTCNRVIWNKDMEYGTLPSGGHRYNANVQFRES